MKKLTAGIFSILLGMVAVNSADAAVASKGYVDSKVGANTTSIETLAQTVADNKTAAENLLNSYKETNDAAVKANADAIADNKGLIQSNATAIGSNTDAIAAEKTARENADNAIKATIGTVAEGTTVVEMISEAQTNAMYNDTAVRGLISGNASAIETLNGEQETQDGRIAALETSLAEGGATANAIAQALADAKSYSDEKDEAQTAELQTYADTAETDAVASAKSYTDTEIAKLTSTENGILKQANAYTDAEVKELADGQVKTNADAIADLDAAYKAADTALDGKITEEATARKNADDAINATIGEVTEGKTVVEMISDAKAAATYNDTEVRGLISGNADAIDALETEQDTQDAAIATAQAAAEAAQTQADKGVADAAAAQITANAAIPAPTAECSNPTNKCVLTYNNSAYTWEVIERGTGEVIE